MADQRIINLANTLVNYSTKVQPGDLVGISASPIALPLLKEVVRFVTRAGGHPVIMMDDDNLTEIFMKEANQDQLEFVSPLRKTILETADVTINLRAPSNTRVMNGISLEKTRARSLANMPLMQTYMNRAAAGELRWTVTNYPCPAYAQEADMSLEDYEAFVYKATFADQDDPIACWQKISAEQQHVCDWLVGKKEVVVKAPTADLKLSIEGRTFINSDGQKNMPSGEVFTGPVEESVNGWVEFTYPAITQGREVEGIRLEFKDGKVVNASAKKNEQFLLSQLDTDAGSRYLGEFAIGTNYAIQQFTKTILYDEKIGGTFHMALGNGYPETGSKNKSSIHWDMICDVREDSQIIVDGEVMYENGQFKI